METKEFDLTPLREMLAVQVSPSELTERLYEMTYRYARLTLEMAATNGTGRGYSDIIDFGEVSDDISILRSLSEALAKCK